MGVAAEVKEAEAKDLPTFQPGKKENSPLRPGTLTGVDCIRLSMRQSLDLTLMVGNFAIKRKRGPSSPLQAVDETFGGRFFRNTDISFWIRVRFKIASVDGN